MNLIFQSIGSDFASVWPTWTPCQVPRWAGCCMELVAFLNRQTELEVCTWMFAHRHVQTVKVWGWVLQLGRSQWLACLNPESSHQVEVVSGISILVTKPDIPSIPRGCAAHLRCCCFGPVGPIFWFAVACMHYCKPKEVRQNLPLDAWRKLCPWAFTVSLFKRFVGKLSTHKSHGWSSLSA